MSAFSFIFKHRNMLFATCTQAIRARTIGSALGLAWLVLYPLLFLTLYYIVFFNILQVRVPGLSTPEYILLIFSGLVPFLCFSESFSLGSVSIVSNRTLLKNTLFPIEIVVAKDVISSHVCMGTGMILVWTAVLFTHGWHFTHLLVPLIFLLQIIMTIGIVWITSTITTYFRDMQQAIPILILFMMMVSPIAYTHDMVPERMQSFLSYNPLAFLMSLYRSLLFDGVLNQGDLAVLILMSLSIYMIGFFIISSLKVTFSNYV